MPIDMAEKNEKSLGHSKFDALVPEQQAGRV